MFLGNSQLKTLTIVGGYYTTSHKNSGGWRIDQKNTDIGVSLAYADIQYIMDAPNPNGDGTRYAKYQIVGSDYFEYVVHGKNFVKGVVKKGQKQFDINPNFGVHRHYRDSKGVYLKWLDYVDPNVKITTSFVSTIYTGVNKGTHIPGTEPILPIIATSMATLPTGIVFKCQTTHTGILNIRKLPTSQSEDLGDVPVGTGFDCTEIADGEVVSGTKTWYRFQNGWISGAWVKVEPSEDTTALKAELVLEKAKVLARDSKISDATVKAKDLVNTLEA